MAGGRGTTFSDINVTPLVDVMLVLLIVFMVAAPLLDQGIAVTLPKAATSTEVGTRGVTITLTREHVVQFNGDVVTMAELRKELAGAPRQSVFIRADRNAYVNRLVDLWDLCRDIGFTEIRIATMSE